MCTKENKFFSEIEEIQRILIIIMPTISLHLFLFVVEHNTERDGEERKVTLPSRKPKA